MSLPPFAVTYDYRCPFARIVHEHLITALEDGADWEVTWAPFSLNQAHVGDGGTPVWDDPSQAADLLAIEAGLVVRDQYPDRFLEVHQGFFSARHDQGANLRDREVISEVLAKAGVDAERVFSEIESGGPRKVFRASHEAAVNEHQVFGVPTFIVGDQAVFTRIMNRPDGDGELARRTIEQLVRMITDHPELNEFKHTTISR